MTENPRAYVPAKTIPTEFPLIDTDPHFKRVVSYARPSDYGKGAAMTAFGPALMLLWERVAPSHVGRGGFAPIMRLTGAISMTAGFLIFYQSSILRFYGWKENKREVDRDLREMTDKVKRGEPVYGHSTLSPYMQGVASRNSRYTGVFLHLVPWFNFVNHNHHGVDTAKYYQQAERELEAERLQKA
ncbi:MAG: hypothetical protein M4579_003515 [Chaenotheca gracillima]|nr:MAG: hypothetical protein M4579_003515 [Chaenotheca gracillima]